MRRHHLHESVIRKAVYAAAREVAIPKKVSCHTFRYDDLLETDVVNAISGGVISEPGELGHRGDWCDRVRTGRVTVVIMFRSAEEMVVVTAWRERRRGR